MATYCFDVDGTLCTKAQDYKKAQPFSKMISMVNNLYDQGHTIVINTARGQQSGVDWEEYTIEQLKTWGVKFHRFYYGKPSADYYIDDKAVKISDFLLGNY
jgi:hypothetical protein